MYRVIVTLHTDSLQACCGAIVVSNSTEILHVWFLFIFGNIDQTGYCSHHHRSSFFFLTGRGYISIYRLPPPIPPEIQPDFRHQ